MYYVVSLSTSVHFEISWNSLYMTRELTPIHTLALRFTHLSWHDRHKHCRIQLYTYLIAYQDRVTNSSDYLSTRADYTKRSEQRSPPYVAGDNADEIRISEGWSAWWTMTGPHWPAPDLPLDRLVPFAWDPLQGGSWFFRPLVRTLRVRLRPSLGMELVFFPVSPSPCIFSARGHRYRVKTFYIGSPETPIHPIRLALAKKKDERVLSSILVFRRDALKRD